MRTRRVTALASLLFVKHVRPMVDGLSRLTDGLGKYVLLIEAAPLATVVHFDEMTQRLARAEKLPFDSLAVNIGRDGLGHSAQFGQKS